MPFNPSLPADNALADAGELRNQFNGLNEKIDALASAQLTWTDLEAVRADIYNETAQAVSGVEPVEITASEPPTAAELQTVIDKLNQLIAALKRT